MPKRRQPRQPIYARAANAGGALALHLYERATRRPVDSVALLLAAATSLTIVINAVFLQTGSRPAPYFAPPLPALQTTESGPKIVAANGTAAKVIEPAVPARSPAVAPPPRPVALRRDDPIADLIGPSPRIAAVQRALSDYGYGQIKPSGLLDAATSSAIEKFEREHKLPATGRVSDRLMNEISTMVGHPIE